MRPNDDRIRTAAARVECLRTARPRRQTKPARPLYFFPLVGPRILAYHLPFLFAGSDRFPSSRLHKNQEHGRYLTRIVGPSATAWGKARNFDSFDLSRYSPGNSTIYGSATLVWALQLLPARAKAMLKISTLNGAKEQRLIVEGSLVECYVSELELAWNQLRGADRSRHTIVDLSGVSWIDARGEAALIAMIVEGARLTAKGVYTKHLIKELRCRASEEYGTGKANSRSKPSSSWR
jgi:hypothetical protein